MTKNIQQSLPLTICLIWDYGGLRVAHCRSHLVIAVWTVQTVFPNIPEWIFPSGRRMLQVIVKERHETIMGYKPRERVALEWFIPIIVELLVL